MVGEHLVVMHGMNGTRVEVFMKALELLDSRFERIVVEELVNLDRDIVLERTREGSIPIVHIKSLEKMQDINDKLHTISVMKVYIWETLSAVEERLRKQHVNSELIAQIISEAHSELNDLRKKNKFSLYDQIVDLSLSPVDAGLQFIYDLSEENYNRENNLDILEQYIEKLSE
ncbi:MULTISPECIES: hypothetical protein [Bacillaceae]|uniref:Uncharacterized protein n=1 Tax=Evansella alkalicola TaxID=745819 RepID=A0ABS6JTC4_9BACI|nr:MULTISPECIES: hypothetical protein [Bacillaceae]MBU9720929.1 hypothetical protein [Bacillus alkalicola]